MVGAEIELGTRADHPVGGAAVGLARGDREVAGQRGSRQRDHDQISDGEVGCTADDVAGLGLADIDLDGADRLLELRELLDFEYAADRKGTASPVRRGMTSSTSWPMRISVCSSSSAGTSQPGAPAATTSRSQLYGSRIRRQPRTAARTARRPRPCRACRGCRCGTAACAPSPCRTRIRSRPPGQCRRRATHSG